MKSKEKSYQSAESNGVEVRLRVGVNCLPSAPSFSESFKKFVATRCPHFYTDIPTAPPKCRRCAMRSSAAIIASAHSLRSARNGDSWRSEKTTSFGLRITRSRNEKSKRCRRKRRSETRMNSTLRWSTIKVKAVSRSQSEERRILVRHHSQAHEVWDMREVRFATELYTSRKAAPSGSMFNQP